MVGKLERSTIILILLMLMSAGAAHAIVITPTDNPMDIENAILGITTGLTINSVTISGHNAGGALSSGTYTNASGTYGIGGGIVISSGDVADYGDGPNTAGGNTTQYGVGATAAQQLLIDPISGGLGGNDVTQIDINFDADGSVDDIFFDVVFGSEEYDEWVGTSFIDAFGLYINGVNIASVGGFPVNIDHPDMAFVGGTELDGILTDGMGGLVHTFSAAITPGSMGNTMTFILADTGDSQLDSTAYISGFGSEPPTPQIPEPGTLFLLGQGLLGAALVARRRRRQ